MPSSIRSNLAAANRRRLPSPFGLGWGSARALALACLLLLLAAPTTLGQGTSGATLRGVVRDPGGAVVPNATVVLLSAARGVRREARSSDDGTYVFTSVDPGPYTVRVESQGFKASEVAVTLAPSETRGLDISVEVGGAAEVVTVTAEEAPIKTETGEKSETITAKQIDNLSIIGRSSLELLRILPGVVGPEQSALESTGFNQGGNASASYTVNGIRGVNNNVSIDGSRVIDIGSNNGTIITPNNDMVQEVTVKTSNYAAEYGSSGVQVIATTKGGSRDFHGELYHYMRPRALAANDRSNTTVGAPRPQSSFNYPGGNIGGPVLLPGTDFNRNRDKLFFWVGFEVQRQRVDPGTRLAVVPTERERRGDFSQSPSAYGTICTPESFAFGCTAAAGGNLAPFADPIGSRLLALYPLPNFTAPAGSAQQGFNYASSVISPVNRTDLKMRFDYNITDSTKMYVRLARESETQDFAYGLWWGPSQYELPSHVIGNNLGRSAAANITTVINPTMTNEIVISASKLKLDNDYADPSRVTRSGLGIENFRTPFGSRAGTPYAPLALIGNWSAETQLWEPGNLPLFAHNDSYSLSDTVSKIYNNHTLKFGGLIEQANKIQNQSGSPEGLVTFTGATSRNTSGGNFAQPRGTGNLWGNIYTGRAEQFQQSTVVPVGKFRFWNFEVYGQDSWKVRPNFTLEYGARVSYFPNNYERQGLGVTFDPSRYVRGAGPYLNGDPQTPNGYLLASRGEIPKGVVDNPPPQFAPRLNFAWDIFGDASTVLRGGAGVFYNRVQGNYQYDILTQPPNTLNVAVNAWSAPNQDLTLSNIGNINPLTFPGTTNVTVQELNSYRIPRITTTSLSVARRLPMENVLEVSYVGTFGRHLPQRRDVNFFLPGALQARGTIGNANLNNPLHRAALSDPAVRSFQPFPDYGQVNFYEFVGTSNYHSLQATLNRQLGRRLQYFATYTFSKALGTTSVEESSGSDQVDPVDIRGRSYGILPFDRTHIFNLSYNWYLPELARGGFRNWFTKGLLNGWQMSGITTFESGRPIRLRFTGAITSAATLRAYFGTNAFTQSSGNAGGIAPILLNNPQTGQAGVGDRYLDLSAVAIPGFGQTGPYQPPFYIRSPRRSNFDVTFFKNFNISESKRFQFRTGLFNVFNQAFANPSLGDINLTLETECIAQAPAGIPRGLAQDGSDVTTAPICDPTQGFRFTEATRRNFGQVVNKHGHRRVELAFKFYF
jgi:hypothetical protein